MFYTIFTECFCDLGINRVLGWNTEPTYFKYLNGTYYKQPMKNTNYTNIWLFKYISKCISE